MKMKLADDTLRPLSKDELRKLTRSEAITLLEAEQRMRANLLTEVASLQEHLVEVGSKHRSIIAKTFGRSSEKSPQNTDPKPRKSRRMGTNKKRHSKLPSERYPNAEVVTKTLEINPPPACPCCSRIMSPSGMYEVSESLTKIPAKYIVERSLRHKYRCSGCHSSILTTPQSPRVIPGSAYTDDLIIDVSLSKFCDLIPIERYCQIAARQGFQGLPPNSLIGTTLKLANFMAQLYRAVRLEALNSLVLFADETPHRMLEGDSRSRWYLWLFMCRTAAFYELHDTRSGDVASRVLADSKCNTLLTDVYAGYKKAVREANELRRSQGLIEIIMAYCNAHARRGFVLNVDDGPSEAEFMVAQYKEIYRLNTLAKDQSPSSVLEIRQEMRPLFENMHAFSEEQKNRFSSKSGLTGAFNYFTNNYSGLTVFLTNHEIPIDNNSSERGLRSHVVGRKTWYGTHSKEAAQAAAIHMTIIETCKLNSVNPREYYTYAVAQIHAGLEPLTPHKYKLMKDQQPKNSS